MAQLEDVKVLGKTIGWKLVLTHDEVERIGSAGDVATVLPGIPAEVRIAVQLIVGGLRIACALGGHDGVDIVSTFFTPSPIIIPR